MSEALDLDLSSEPIAVGRTAEVFAIDDDLVVKLLKPGFDAHVLRKEAAQSEVARRAGVRAPVVGNQIEVGGRPGLVSERIIGSSMLEVLFVEPAEFETQAVSLAGLHADMLQTSIKEGLPAIKDVLAERIEGADLPSTTRSAAKDVLLSLPDGNAVLHGDFHPGNVLLAQDGPVIIDWANAAMGSPAADVARTLLLLSQESAAEVLEERTELDALVAAFAAVYRQHCSELLGLSMSDIEDWRLPVVAARLGEGIDAEAGALMEEVERLTR